MRSWEKPAACPSITEEEKHHIEEALGVNDKAGREAEQKVSSKIEFGEQFKIFRGQNQRSNVASCRFNKIVLRIEDKSLKL